MSETLSDSEFRELNERTAMVQELAATAGWEYLRDRANASFGPKQERVLQGLPDDYTEYKALVAWLDGVEFVLKLPERMAKELEAARSERAEQ